MRLTDRTIQLLLDERHLSWWMLGTAHPDGPRLLLLGLVANATVSFSSFPHSPKPVKSSFASEQLVKTAKSLSQGWRVYLCHCILYSDPLNFCSFTSCPYIMPEICDCAEASLTHAMLVLPIALCSSSAPPRRLNLVLECKALHPN